MGECYIDKNLTVKIYESSKRKACVGCETMPEQGRGLEKKNK